MFAGPAMVNSFLCVAEGDVQYAFVSCRLYRADKIAIHDSARYWHLQR